MLSIGVLISVQIRAVYTPSFHPRPMKRASLPLSTSSAFATLRFIASGDLRLARYRSTSFCLLGVSAFPVKMVLREVPVFFSAFVLTLLCPIILLVSFWSARGDAATYRSAVLGWSFIAPMVVVLLLLPGEQTKPEATSLNSSVLLLLVCASQMSAARMLREWFWKNGAPRT